MNLIKKALLITHDHVATLREYSSEMRKQCKPGKNYEYFDGQFYAYDTVCKMLLKVILDDEKE